MVYVAVDNDPTSSADSTQDEWVARLRLINMGIASWERQDVIWHELLITYTHGTPITAAQSFLTTMNDFRGLPGANLQFVDANSNITYMELVEPSKAQYLQLGGARKAYVTGNSALGFTMNFTFILGATDPLIGRTMSLMYYKSAAKMVGATDKPEMNDPQYLVSYVAAKKNLFNGRTDIASNYLNDAQESMDNMRIRNEFTPPYGDNRLPDVDLVRDGDSLGY